eukprot:g7052.t1
MTQTEPCDGCLACPAGTFSAGTNWADCQECAMGKYSAAGASTCEPCAAAECTATQYAKCTTADDAVCVDCDGPCPTDDPPVEVPVNASVVLAPRFDCVKASGGKLRAPQVAESGALRLHASSQSDVDCDRNACGAATFALGATAAGSSLWARTRCSAVSVSTAFTLFAGSKRVRLARTVRWAWQRVRDAHTGAVELSVGTPGCEVDSVYVGTEHPEPGWLCTRSIADRQERLLEVWGATGCARSPPKQVVPSLLAQPDGGIAAIYRACQAARGVDEALHPLPVLGPRDPQKLLLKPFVPRMQPLLPWSSATEQGAPRHRRLEELTIAAEELTIAAKHCATNGRPRRCEKLGAIPALWRASGCVEPFVPPHAWREWGAAHDGGAGAIAGLCNAALKGDADARLHCGVSVSCARDGAALLRAAAKATSTSTRVGTTASHRPVAQLKASAFGADTALAQLKAAADAAPLCATLTWGEFGACKDSQHERGEQVQCRTSRATAACRERKECIPCAQAATGPADARHAIALTDTTYQQGSYPYLVPGTAKKSLRDCQTACLEDDRCLYGTYVTSDAHSKHGHNYDNSVKEGECWLAGQTHASPVACGVPCQGFRKVPRAHTHKKLDVRPPVREEKRSCTATGWDGQNLATKCCTDTAACWDGRIITRSPHAGCEFDFASVPGTPEPWQCSSPAPHCECDPTLAKSAFVECHFDPWSGHPVATHLARRFHGKVLADHAQHRCLAVRSPGNSLACKCCDCDPKIAFDLGKLGLSDLGHATHFVGPVKRAAADKLETCARACAERGCVWGSWVAGRGVCLLAFAMPERGADGQFKLQACPPDPDDPHKTCHSFQAQGRGFHGSAVRGDGTPRPAHVKHVAHTCKWAPGSGFLAARCEYAHPHVPHPARNEAPCCDTMTASCVACRLHTTLHDYCSRYPKTPGCARRRLLAAGSGSGGDKLPEGYEQLHDAIAPWAADDVYATSRYIHTQLVHQHAITHGDPREGKGARQTRHTDGWHKWPSHETIPGAEEAWCTEQGLLGHHMAWVDGQCHYGCHTLRTRAACESAEDIFALHMCGTGQYFDAARRECEKCPDFEWMGQDMHYNQECRKCPDACAWGTTDGCGCSNKQCFLQCTGQSPCRHGFEGDGCTTNTDDCAAEPCSGDGEVCVDKIGGFACVPRT